MDTLQSVPSSAPASLLTCGQRSENEKRDEEVRHKQEFDLQIRQMLSKRRRERRKIFSREKLKKYISEENAAKLKITYREYDLLSRYDLENMFGEDILVTVDETEKSLKQGIKRNLISSTSTAAATSALDPQRVYRRFIHQGQIYDKIYDAHNAVGHGGEKRTFFQVSKTVANVAQEKVKLFISLRQICNIKRVPRCKKGVVKPIVSESFGERGQMDLIDMYKDGGCLFNYILHYQDNLTKFSVLRPLRSKQAIKVARHLLDIITLIGAPRYLQSNNGREFVVAVIHQLRTELWPKLILINGKPRHPQSQGSIERANGDITKMLGSWMCENRTRDWSASLPFIQFNTNIAYSRDVGLSPYKAVFGIEHPIGMQTELSPSMYKQLQ
nr:KRAB-A domain-containing protein 2-like [Procambarus clarkii]